MTSTCDTTIPLVTTTSLDTVWFQVGGTICNLRCHHCFISCTPENDKFKFMSLEACKGYLEQSRTLGVKEFYFTGGEPLANPEICDILEAALSYGPATVLTNATLFRDNTLDRLEAMAKASSHTLEIRVSLDGYTAKMNDPIRGEGTFDRAIDGVRRLVEHGFQPILTITRTWCGTDCDVLEGFRELLAGIGYGEPRLKILPRLKIGAEVERSGGYGKEAHITQAMMEGFDQNRLLCSSSRLVTDQGVWICPILLDDPAGRMSDDLAGAIRDYPLSHAACHTCWQNDAICSNKTTAATTTACDSQA